MTIVSPWLMTKEETIKDWAQSVQVGAIVLIKSLEYHGYHQLEHLRLDIHYECSRDIERIMYQVTNPVLYSLNVELIIVNSKRKAKGLFPISLAGDQRST